MATLLLIACSVLVVWTCERQYRILMRTHALRLRQIARGASKRRSST